MFVHIDKFHCTGVQFAHTNMLAGCMVCDSGPYFVLLVIFSFMQYSMINYKDVHLISFSYLT